MTAFVIYALLIGFSTAFYLIFAVHILFFRRGISRFQRVTGWILTVWALWELKDVVLASEGMYREDVLQWIVIVDGWQALSYMVFVFEATQTGWATWRRLFLSALPFLFFTVAYAVWPSKELVASYEVFLWFFGWGMVCWGYLKARKYLRSIRENYSDLENIDVSWLKTVFMFALASQLLWLGTAVWSNVWADIVYIISAMVLWLVVLRYTWNFRPVNIETDLPETGNEADYAFAGELERLFEEEKLYLKPGLNINELAERLGSNRTYVSRYFNQVLRTSFYDYVNRLRIFRMAIPMIEQHPEYKIEYVAMESGFRSISTFRRAFQKITGKNPSQYENYAV